MSSAYCRRQFLTHSLLLAGAAVLLPIGRLSAADSANGVEPGDAATATVLGLIRRYSDDVHVATEGITVRMTARIRCFDTMQQALSCARSHGITRIHATGNLTTFELGTRKFEIENVPHVA